MKNILFYADLREDGNLNSFNSGQILNNFSE